MSYSSSPLPPDKRLSPRCFFNSSSLSNPSPLASTATHSRQSSILSSASSLSSSTQFPYHLQQSPSKQYVYQNNSFQHSRQSSNSSLKDLPKFSIRSVPVDGISPTSVDQGYQTMGYQGGESPGNTSAEGSTMMIQKERKIPKVYKNSNRNIGFESLSDDLVLKIFSYLSTNSLCISARVCRRFYFLAWEPRLWKTITLSGEMIQADKALFTVFRLISRNSPKASSEVERISLNGCAKLSDAGLQLIARTCPKISQVELRGCQLISNDGLAEVLTRCININRLDITGGF